MPRCARCRRVIEVGQNAVSVRGGTLRGDDVDPWVEEDEGDPFQERFFHKDCFIRCAGSTKEVRALINRISKKPGG